MVLHYHTTPHTTTHTTEKTIQNNNTSPIDFAIFTRYNNFINKNNEGAIIMGFDAMWDRILRCEGEEFSTVRKVRFTYRIIGGAVVPQHTGYPLAKSEFIKAYNFGELKNPGQISNLVRGSSYVFAIMTDPRIK